MGLSVGLVTTWRVRCGIASYSEKLAIALSKLGIDVYVVNVPRFGAKNDTIMKNVAEKIPLDKVDIIHCQHEYGIYQNLERGFFSILKGLGKPIVTTMHSVGAWEVDSLIADVSSRVIVHNLFCQKRCDYPNVRVIPHGATPLETPPPPKEACKKSLGIQPEVPIVGYMGFISNYKGLEMLIEAMVKVPKAALLIGGGWHVERETEYIYKLREWSVKVLPSRCRWLGYVADKDLSLCYGAMDIVVYPSRFSTESGALIMALSHQKAVIASNIAPFREKEKDGALKTFSNTADLTKKIKWLLSDDNARAQLEKGAKQYIEATSWSKVAQEHQRLYNSIPMS